MKFDMSCKVYSIVFSKLFRKIYKKYFPDSDVSTIIKDVKKEYKAMIKRTPGLSKNNYMASNLKGAAYFFSIAKKAPNMTPELMDKMVEECMYSNFMMKLNKKKREKGLLFSDKAQDRIYQDSLRSQKSNDEMDWKFTFEKGINEMKYNMVKCGVCRLAKRENVLEYLPCMCKMDYSKYEVAGAKLIRTKTLANGDDICDFHLIRIEKDK